MLPEDHQCMRLTLDILRSSAPIDADGLHSVTESPDVICLGANDTPFAIGSATSIPTVVCVKL